MFKWFKKRNTRDALRRYVEVEYHATGEHAEFLVGKMLRGESV